MDLAGRSEKRLRATLQAGSLLLVPLLFACGTSSPTGGGGLAARLLISTQPSGEAQSGVALNDQPVIQLADAAGQPVAQRGVLISASVVNGEAVLSGVSAVRTDADGSAVFSGLILSGVVGVRTLRFTASGLAAAQSNPIELKAGPVAALALAAGNNLTAPAGGDLPVAPSVRVTDGAGNPIAGVEVIFAVTSGGGSVIDGTQTTGPDGRATVTAWTLGNLPGLNTLTATSVALPGAAVVFSATAVLGSPSVITIVAGDGQSAPAGSPVPVRPKAKVTDQAGNPVVGVRVVFTVTLGGGIVGGANPLTNSEGLAELGFWLLGPDPGPNQLTATVPGGTAQTVSATGTEVPVVIFEGNNQLGFPEDTLSHTIIAQVRNGAGVGQPGVLVTFEATVGGGSFEPATVITNSNGFVQSKWVLGPTVGAQEAIATAPGAAAGTLSATAEVWKQISPGWRHSCAVSEVGKAYCWGDNDFNQLGLGTAPSSSKLNPLPVSGGLTFTTLQASAGGNFSCGIVFDGSGYCWGSNGHGQRGDGTPPQGIGLSTRFPTQVAGGFQWQQISLGGDHACGIVLGGEAYCWGANANGNLGDGTTTERSVPTPVSGGLLFKWIAAGRGHNCGITTADQVFCWGASIAFQGGSNIDVLTPTPVATTVTFATLSGGWISTCGLSTTGVAYCWGNGSSGQNGDGTFSARPTPTAVAGGFTWVTVEMRGQTGCGITTGGESYCWGYNLEGELGNGTVTNSSVPKPIAGPGFSTFTAIQSGGQAGCGLIGTPGRPRCWGQNAHAQVGDGTKIMRTVPTPVRFP
jgi:alpha-tubulin suppressor-like RCC1 family protein